MKNYIDNCNFKALENQKYWAPPASWDDIKKQVKTKERIFEGNDYWLGAVKKDGAFYKFIKDEDGNMELLSRSKGVGGDYAEKIAWVPQLHEFFNSLPNGTCLLGELYFPNNEGSNKVTTIMGCLVDKAIDRQKNGTPLHYYVFDVLAYDGKSMLKCTAAERFIMLNSLAMESNYECLEFAKYTTGEELWEVLQTTLAAGGEGIVMTRAASLYQPGKRPSKDCQKVKKELLDTIDCFFTGRATAPTMEYTGKEIQRWPYWKDMRTDELLEGFHFEGYKKGEPLLPVTKPYFHNWAGSLEIGVFKEGKIYPIGFLSGLTEEIKANVKKYAMKPIEVSAMQLTEDGALRHGKFIGFRPDLSIDACTWEKIFG